MLYRYRLRNNEKNEKLTSRNIDGVVLYKNRWFYTEKPLNVDQYEHLIISDSAESKEAFARKDEERRRKARERKEELTRRELENRTTPGKTPSPQPSQKVNVMPVVEPQSSSVPVYNYSPELVDSLSKEDAFDLGKALLFAEEELRPLDEQSLKDLIKMDLTLD